MLIALEVGTLRQFCSWVISHLLSTELRYHGTRSKNLKEIVETKTTMNYVKPGLQYNVGNSERQNFAECSKNNSSEVLGVDLLNKYNNY
jgi:hypothetical protein